MLKLLDYSIAGQLKIDRCTVFVIFAVEVGQHSVVFYIFSTFGAMHGALWPIEIV
jgi:hypothetical protein